MAHINLLYPVQCLHETKHQEAWTIKLDWSVTLYNLYQFSAAKTYITGFSVVVDHLKRNKSGWKRYPNVISNSAPYTVGVFSFQIFYHMHWIIMQLMVKLCRDNARVSAYKYICFKNLLFFLAAIIENQFWERLRVPGEKRPSLNITQ